MSAVVDEDEIDTGNDPFEKLSDKKRRAILLILEGHSNTAVGTKLGTSRAVVAAWKTGDPLFKAALAKAREDLVEEAMDVLRGSAARVARRLVTAATGPTWNQNALHAAKFILDRVLGTEPLRFATLGHQTDEEIDDWIQGGMKDANLGPGPAFRKKKKAEDDDEDDD